MNFVHSPVTCSLLGPKYNSEPYSQTPPAFVLPINLETKFQIHTKRYAKITAL
jgi:hypothetical protein